ncbi:precorrin-3B synthase [Dactylosporangium aurantiacum]|uniref:Precorrin-3B synthase n=1 Tax=Dactylosporangium aurantiacum TaxID=35754 RepID=A0A9Q9IL91_9ACTN|nr:precorrin-3B synthase [Dactylosporangium aurantiacum]MDG6104050.1 precorrin-3B synthase [Dactylosporangium aurantiacum]UWZ56928.1 precorrin-3B synthase [Dactylosporangium aurantiacum]
MQAASGRDAPDRCPGAVQVHAAADGGLARVRLPGGRLGRDALAVLRAAAIDLGDPDLELTSRGNVQVRALRPGAELDLAARLTGAGLLPSATHERVRNLVASPLSGRDGRGALDVRPVVAAFDAGLCADAALAALPGRFLVTLDDGRGDVTPLGGDVGLYGDRLTLAGTPATAPAAGDPAALLLRATRAFLAERAEQGGTAWRLAELTDGPARVAARLGASLDEDARPSGGGGSAAGWTSQAGGLAAITAVVPLGRLTPAHAAALLDAAPEEIIVTPWRTVVVPDVPVEEAGRVETLLTAAGLVTDPASRWAGVTACAGRPGCAKALADVRADARAAVAAGTTPAGSPVHWVGCERRCGAPKGRHVEMLATADGYRSTAA